jgi:hypothetical protein
MTPEQIAFIEQRRRQIRYWPWLAAGLLLPVVAAYVWLWLEAPFNINPWMVLEQFHHKAITDEDLILLAARGTLALIGCGLFVLVLVLLISLALWNERRLIRVIDELSVTAPSAAAGASCVADALLPAAEPAPAPESASSSPDSDG